MSVSSGVTQWEKLTDKFGEKAITENASGVFLLNVLVAKGRTIEKLREVVQKHGQHSEGISDEFLRAHYAHAAIYLYESTGYYSPDGKSVSYKELVYRAYLELCEAPVALAGSRNAVEIFQFAFGNTLRRLFADSTRVESVGETVVGLKPRPTYKNIANAVKDLLHALYPNGVHPKIAHELRAVGDFLLGQNSLLVTPEGKERALQLGLMIDKAIGPQSAESEDSPAPAADAPTAVERGEGKVEEEEEKEEREEEERVFVGPAGGKEEEGGEALFSSSKDSPFPPSAFPKRFTAERAGERGGLVEVADTSAFGANVSDLQGEERSKAVMEDTLVVKDKDATVSSIALAAVNAFMALNETDRKNAAGAMYNYLKVAEGGRPKFFPDRNPGTIEDRVEVLAAIISGLATANLDLNEIVKNFAGALFDRDPTLYSQETAKKALREFAAVNWRLLGEKKRDDYNKNEVGKGSVRPMYEQLGKLNEPKRGKKWLVYDLWVKASPLLQSVNIFWVKGRDGKDVLVFNEWSINAVVTTYRDKAVDGMLEYVKSALNGSVRAQVSKWIGTAKVLYAICQHFKFPVGKTIADFADLHRQCKNLVFDLDDTKASDVMDLVVEFFDITDKRPLVKLFSVSDTVPYGTVVQRTASAPAAPFPEPPPVPDEFDLPAVQPPAAPPPTQKNPSKHSVVINPEDVDEGPETAGEGEEEERVSKRQKLVTSTTTTTTTTKTVEKEKGPQKRPTVVANLPRPGTPPKKPEEPKQRPQTVFAKPPSTSINKDKQTEIGLLVSARSKAAASSTAVATAAAIRSTLPAVAPSGRPHPLAVDTKSVLQRPAAVEEPVETSPFGNPVLTKLLRLRVGNETQAPDSLHDTSDAATGLERRGELYARFDITRELVLEVLADLAAAVRKDTLFAATPAGSKLLAMCGQDMGILARSRHAVHTAFVRDERPFDLRRDDERLHIDPMIAAKRQFSAVSNLIADTIENPPPTLLPGFTVESELYVFKTVNYEARRQQEELQHEQVSGSGFLSELSGGSGSGSGFLEDLPGGPGSGFLPNLQARSGIPFPVLGPSGNSLPSQGSNGPSRLGFVPVGGLSDEGLSERQAQTPPQ